MPPRKKTKTTHAKENANALVSKTASMASGSRDATQAKDVTKQPPRRQLRGKRGGLKDMLSMPLDIVIEIMQLLHPRDLLNLARTNKSCRELLMNRSNEFLWKAARAQVEGLPKVPPGLSEPAYANLVFFNNCHICLKPNVQTIYHKFHLRLCKEDCGLQILKADAVNTLIQEVKDHVGEHAVRAFLNTDRSRATARDVVYFKPQVDAFRLKWGTLTDRGEQIQFVQECAGAAVARERAASNLYRWMSDQLDNRKKELGHLRDARFEAIKTRLRDEGCGKELEALDVYSFECLRKLPAVHRPHKLTDRAWNSIRDDVVKYVQRCYTEQLRREQLQLFSKRMGLLRAAFSDHRKETGRLDRLRTMADACEPEAGDLAYLPEFREVIEAPAEVDVSKETFAQLMAPWPQLVAKWTGERKAEFERLMLPALKGTLAVAAKDILDLAVATFSCYKCWGVRLRWPAVLNHPCFRPQSQGPSEDAVGTEFDRAVYTTRSYWDVFSIKPACVGVHFSRTRSTIRVCGQDPDTVTWETMQADPARLMCKLCSTVDRCQIFDWVAAAIHEAEHWDDILDPDQVVWLRVPEDQAVQAGKLAEALDASTRDEVAYTTDGQHYLTCALCSHYQVKHTKSMQEHIKKRHGKKKSVNGVDFFAFEESYPRARKGLPPVWMYSVTLAKNAEVKSVVEAGRGFFATGFPSEILSYTTLADDPLDSFCAGWLV